MSSPMSPSNALLSPSPKVWGDVRTVEVYRVQGAGLGISIVGGKVRTDEKKPQLVQ